MSEHGELNDAVVQFIRSDQPEVMMKLANDTGVPLSTLKAMVSGAKPVTLEVVEIFAAHMNYTPGGFLNSALKDHRKVAA